MDAIQRTADTLRMDTRQKTIEELLAAARDITQRTLDRVPDAVLAEVFRQLCFQNESIPMEALDDVSRPVH